MLCLVCVLCLVRVFCCINLLVMLLYTVCGVVFVLTDLSNQYGLPYLCHHLVYCSVFTVISVVIFTVVVIVVSVISLLLLLLLCYSYAPDSVFAP